MYFQYAFNNIKFDKEAPDFAALVPFNTSESEDEVEESNDKKSWWFYNQVNAIQSNTRATYYIYS